MKMKRIKLGNIRKMGAGHESKTLIFLPFDVSKKNKRKTWVGRVKANKTFYEDSLDVFIAWGKGNA